MVKHFITVLSVLTLAISCESEMASNIVSQEAAIDSYISSEFPDCEIVRTGTGNRVIIIAGTGATLEKGDRVMIYYAGYTLGTSGPTAEFVNDSTTVTVGQGDLIKGLDDGLVGMKEGEESVILFTTQYAYGKEAVGTVPEQTAVMFDVYADHIVKE